MLNLPHVNFISLFHINGCLKKKDNLFRKFCIFIYLQQDYRHYQADSSLSYNAGELTQLKYQQLGTEDGVRQSMRRFLETEGHRGEISNFFFCIERVFNLI